MQTDLTAVTDDELLEIEQACRNEQPAAWRDEIHNAYLRDVPRLLATIYALKIELRASMLLLGDPNGVVPSGVIDMRGSTNGRNGHG